jgi:tetratricopeptide (TPR) repeat protein
MKRASALIGVFAVVAGATYVVRGHGSSEAPVPAPASPRDVEAVTAGAGGIGTAAAPGSGGRQEIDRLIGVFEEQVRRQPSALDYTFLGELYAQRGRLTGDVATYARAEEALDRALEISPDDREAQALLASVRFTSHDFPGALRLAAGLLAGDPSDLGALAVAGDARLELGDYAGATAAYDELARLLPDSASVTVRRARLAQLLGQVPEARRLAAVAEAAAVRAGLDGADLSWYRSFRASMELESGRYSAAVDLYRSGVRVAPDYHLARAGLGRALAASGRLTMAIRHYRRAIELLPDPGYLAALGDLYVLRGHGALAREQYSTVEAIATLARVNRQVYNRALVSFYADHDRNPDRAVALAGAELAVRKDVYGWDAYAWALFRAGRFPEAREASDRALVLGTRDARLLYHSGMIALALGDEDAAAHDLRAALDISPVFDPLQARAARQALNGAGGT